MTCGFNNQSPAGCSIKDDNSRADRPIRAQQFVQINFQETNICDTIINDFQIVPTKLSTQMSSGSQSYYLRQSLLLYVNCRAPGQVEGPFHGLIDVI